MSAPRPRPKKKKEGRAPSGALLRVAGSPRVAAAWRAELARLLAEESGAELVAVFTCPPARPLDAEQAVVPREREGLVNEVFDRFLGRVERGQDGIRWAPARAGAFAPLEGAVNRKLAEQLRRDVYRPAGIEGVIMATFVDAAGAVFGWVVMGSARSSADLLAEWGDGLSRIAEVASGTLRAALDLAQAVGAAAQRPDPELLSLSDREREVVHLICLGLGDNQMANALGISEHTVGTHLKRIYRRLGVHTRGELVARVGRVRPPSRSRATRRTTPPRSS